MGSRNEDSVVLVAGARLMSAPLQVGLLLLVFSLVAGCSIDENLFGPGNPGAGTGGTGGGTGGTGGEGARPPAHSDSMDILLALDNSRSMADKQEILGLAVPELIRSLVNPLCIDSNGTPVAQQPATPDDDCPEGSERQLRPQTDIHLGVITTSLGGHGADACSGTTIPMENDQGHLITRGPDEGQVQTYQNQGFLAWDPEQELDPPGEMNQNTLQTNLKGLVLGAGQQGCGYEAGLESWYRFLVDPNPYASIEVEDSKAVLTGTDDLVLEQRRDFLRPNSLLAIVVLSDENDCSVRDGGQFYFASQIYNSGTSVPFHLPKPRAACEDDPNDPCCRSCGQAAADGCSDANDDCGDPLSVLEDSINLRCFDQKRRFGIDFLYPISRYVDGMESPQISDRDGNVVDNPLFIDLNPDDDITDVRDERLVFMTALVGVPWQDLARQTAGGTPNLVEGLDADGSPVGAFQSAEEMADNGTWDLIIGDPANYEAPGDPFMLESIEPRSGTHPIVNGEVIAPPGAVTDANSINGHEYSIPSRDDLQYTCVFPLIQPRDCLDTTQVACDCPTADNDNPLCQDTNDQFGTTQFRAKAYPGVRYLQVVKARGPQGVAGSICPAQVNDQQELDFGYIPLVRTLIEAVAPTLNN